MSVKVHRRFLRIARPVSKELASAIKTVGPVELAANTDTPLPERLCRAVAGQQLSTKAAQAIWGRVEGAAGRKPLLRWAAASRPASLRGCGLSAAKTKAIKAIADEFLSGRMTERRLRRLDAGERCDELTSIWGVGQWTADMINIFYFGEQDVWPGSDSSVVRTLRALVDAEATLDDVAERFSPQRSYLAVYMYRHADLVPT